MDCLFGSDPSSSRHANNAAAMGYNSSMQHKVACLTHRNNYIFWGTSLIIVVRLKNIMISGKDDIIHINMFVPRSRQHLYSYTANCPQAINY